MKVENNHIFFKSTPDNYSKELGGLKCCTVRRISLWSELKVFELFYEAWLATNDVIDYKITIIDTQTRGQFTRTISDISEFEGVWIISWRQDERRQVAREL